MSRIVNLGRARKAKARKEDKAQAAENRARFGATRAERELEAARADKAARTLDQARRERED